MIDVGGPCAPARGGQELRVGDRRLRARRTTTTVLARAAGGRAERRLAELRRRLAAIAFATIGRVRVGDRALVPARGRLPGDVRPGVRPRARALVRREPAPARRVLRGARRTDAPALVRRAAPGEGRSRSTTSTISRPRGCSPRELDGPACVIVKHANPCGVAVGGDDRGGVREGARGRSRLGLRRRRRRQPRGHRRARRGARRAVRRGALRARVRRAGARERSRAKPSLRVLEHTEQRAPDDAERDYRRVLGGLLVQERDWAIGGRDEHGGRVRRGRGRAVGRSPLRVARRQARDVERDRARARRPDARDRSRADEPRRRGPDRDREGARARTLARRARCSPRTRSSRSPTGRSSRSTPASRRSSSRAARSATPR